MRYNSQKIERKWQKIWRESKLYEPDFLHAENPFYNLMMFPYPSAEGLHVGNSYAFTGSDAYGRFQRMQGKDVFQPIGLDGFGIHSENYALKIGRHPAQQARVSEKRFYKQLQAIGNGFAWDERLETYDPKYYQWTQWLFIQLFKAGLAYRKKAEVNWCTGCLTVLADEQVIDDACERCGNAVIKKELEQWFFKITDYAERLLKNLDTLDWSEKVKIAQRNWIGKSEGVLIKFQIANFRTSDVHSIEVFTTRPDTIMGVSFIALSPDHPLSKAKSYKLKAQKYEAVHPITGKHIPIVVADYVLGDVGTGAIMGVPAHDERDYEFAKKFNLEIKNVIDPLATPVLGESLKEVSILSEEKYKKILKGEIVYKGLGILRNSGKFDGMNSQLARRAITEQVKGEWKTTYRLRDWLISRQRYWGPPIPMIHCEQCKWQPVPEKDLPVLLPKVKNFRPTGTGQSPLASVKSFYKTQCPVCGGDARRETDVSDTFLDSSWYYLGYLIMSHRKTAGLAMTKTFNLANTQIVFKKWLPVNMYIGGAEHSVLHLLYARFIAMALHDAGHINFEEPFTVFRAHGLLIKEGAKMSKSKGNVINPDEYIARFGADTLRMYLMFLAPFSQGGDFRDQAVLGAHRFLNRVWKRTSDVLNGGTSDVPNIKITKILHQTIKKVTGDIQALRYNTAISALMILLRAFEDSLRSLRKTIGLAKTKTLHKKTSDIQNFKIFLQLLAPFAPHITEELWHALGEKKSIHRSLWPQYDEKLITEEFFNLVIQINGKIRKMVGASRGINQEEAQKLAEADAITQKYLLNKKIIRIIFIPDRLINFVVE